MNRHDKGEFDDFIAWKGSVWKIIGPIDTDFFIAHADIFQAWEGKLYHKMIFFRGYEKGDKWAAGIIQRATRRFLT